MSDTSKEFQRVQEARDLPPEPPYAPNPPRPASGGTNSIQLGFFGVALIVGFVAGYFIASMNSNRYQLKESGVDGIVYKMDTRSGQTWMVTPDKETPIK